MYELNTDGADGVVVGVEGKGTFRYRTVSILDGQRSTAAQSEGHLLGEIGFSDAYVGVGRLPPGVAIGVPVVQSLVVCHVLKACIGVEARIGTLLHATLAVVQHPGLGTAGTTGQLLPGLAADEVGTEAVHLDGYGVAVDDAGTCAYTVDDGIFSSEGYLQVNAGSVGMSFAHSGV